MASFTATPVRHPKATAFKAATQSNNSALHFSIPNYAVTKYVAMAYLVEIKRQPGVGDAISSTP
jgi:hypothetical protein